MLSSICLWIALAPCTLVLAADEDVTQNPTEIQTSSKSNADTDSKTSETTAVKKKEIDPFLKKVMKSCQGVAIGEQVEIDGMAVTCEKKHQSVEFVDFSKAEQMDGNELVGFALFNERYLQGLYFSLAAGYSNYASMTSYADQARLEDNYLANGLSGEITPHPHGYGLHFNLGLMAHPLFMLEAGYTLLGSVGFSAALSDGNVNYSDEIIGNMHSLDVNFLGRFPLANFMNFPSASKMHALTILGVHQWSRTMTSTFTTPAEVTSKVTASSGFGACLGLGVQYKHNDQFSARGLWQYKLIGNEGVGSLMLTLIMHNHSRYGMAIQNKIVEPIAGMFK
ncbi:MAG: hypothetical protein OEZ43_10645 [Gammaproteobacteria bacterium]|nr:hypothetical protein [Gammaproteobacteria bacterium]